MCVCLPLLNHSSVSNPYILSYHYLCPPCVSRGYTVKSNIKNKEIIKHFKTSVRKLFDLGKYLRSQRRLLLDGFLILISPCFLCFQVLLDLLVSVQDELLLKYKDTHSRT